jgi:protein CWC15
MSNTHRPTYYAPMGQKQSNIGVPTYSFSVKDQTAHTRMKYRTAGQASAEEMKSRDLAVELERKEAQLVQEKNKSISSVLEEEKHVDTTKLLISDRAHSERTSAAEFDDADAKASDDDFGSSRYFILYFNH